MAYSDQHKSAFPEITGDENKEIDKARDAGFSTFVASFQGADFQAKRTLELAREFNRRKAVQS